MSLKDLGLSFSYSFRVIRIHANRKDLVKGKINVDSGKNKIPNLQNAIYLLIFYVELAVKSDLKVLSKSQHT